MMRKQPEYEYPNCEIGQLFQRKKTVWNEMRKVPDSGGNLAFMLNHNAEI